ncbi:MAG TPA: hypothetical protein VFI17_05995 [Solirubrobacterales bacterium]|nr:hypothetical protein [Solirubrobacterales bacterium]
MAERVSAEGRAVKPIHKRSQQWAGQPFAALEDAAALATELSGLLREQGAVVPLTITVTTEDREYRDLGTSDLQELAAELSLDTIESLSISSAAVPTEPVAVALRLVETRSSPSTWLAVEGSNQVAVDGIKAWIAREIEARLERARESAEPDRLPREEGKPVPWIRWLNHPWAIQIGGGAMAAVLGTALIFLLTR